MIKAELYKVDDVFTSLDLPEQFWGFPVSEFDIAHTFKAACRYIQTLTGFET